MHLISPSEVTQFNSIFCELSQFEETLFEFYCLLRVLFQFLKLLSILDFIFQASLHNIFSDLFDALNE